MQTQGDPFEPVRIGFLIDMDLGQLLADCIDPYILAIEDSLNEGIYDRPIELFTVDARGLPRENFRKLIAGTSGSSTRAACVVIGPFIADNSETLVPYANAAERAGAALDRHDARVRRVRVHRRQRRHPDRVGDVRELAVPARATGRSGFLWEKGSASDMYADYFRRTALQLGLEITKEVVLDFNPKNMKESLAEMRDLGTEAVAHVGYGYSTIHYARRSASSTGTRRGSWTPRSCSIRTPTSGPQGLEGWHGIDQLGEDGANPNYEAMIERFEARFGRTTRNVVVALAYDTARVAMQGIANARIPTPGAREAGARDDQVDAVHERRPVVLHHVRRVRPPRLQGRLPHDPRAARRRAPLPRLLPAAMAVNSTPLSPAVSAQVQVRNRTLGGRIPRTRSAHER